MRIEQYKDALSNARIMLEQSEELEIRSALKQAANDQGIAYGEEMYRFVKWAEKELGVSHEL